MVKVGTKITGKYFTGEGSASFEKLEKPVRTPNGRQLNKLKSMLFTIMKTCCFTTPSYIPPEIIWS